MTLTSGTDHIPKRCRWIIGIDEAGRGPVAGPLSVGLVLMTRKSVEELMKILPHVKDSKKLSAPKREDIVKHARILEQKGALYARTILSSAYHIDTDGTSACLRGSIQEGIEELLSYIDCGEKEVFILLDGSLKAPAQYRQQTFTGGDNKYFPIALASIYAKTTRDGVMEQYDIKYPQYDFYAHKGYGTPEHMKRIKEHGLSPIHRVTFLKKIIGTQTK